MAIFHDEKDETSTFGPSMSAALSLHKEKKEKKDKLSKDEHIDAAKEHLDAATGTGEEHEHDDNEQLGEGLSSLEPEEK